MKTYKYIITGLYAAALAFGFASCSDDETYDVVGNPDNLVYFGAGNDNTKSIDVIKTPSGALEDMDVKLPVKILRQTTSDVSVTVSPDASLVADYNEAHETEYEAMPTDILSGGKLTVTIKQGEMIAADSATIHIERSALSQLDDATYLLPVRISEAGSPISGQRGTAYIIAAVQTKYIADNVGPDDIDGSLVTDCGSWTATYDNGTAINAAELFDSDLTNGPQLRSDGNDGKSQTIIVDFKSNRQITGLRLSRWAYYYSWWDWWYTYDFSEVTVSVSTDGNEWTSLGSASSSQMYNDEKGYQYVSLYEAVSARYLKLCILSGSSSVSSLAELGVYAK